MADADSRDTVSRLLAVMSDRPRPLALVGRVQPYAWGGVDYLRDLTGLELVPGAPAAEWWIGAHPSAPSLVFLPDGTSCPLDALIAADPVRLLGPRVSARFGGRLPFLLKVLDVGQMLSIQAHPTKRQAEAGFAREQADGIPIDAAHRSYRDDNHKPEAQIALSPFWMLFGFREPDAMARVLAERPELQPLGDRLAALGRAHPADTPGGEIVRALFEHVMRLPQPAVDALVEPLVARLAPAFRQGLLSRESPDFWAARAATQFRAPGGGHDRGILSIYLMNLVALAPGEGRYFGAGLVHAYLEGTAVEIMANSDNVIRGGLTPKHIDVPELLRVLDFAPSLPEPLVTRDVGTVERRYTTPAHEFALDRLRFSGPDECVVASHDGPAVLIVIEGGASLHAAGEILSLARGGAVFIPAGLEYSLSASQPALSFRAYVP